MDTTTTVANFTGNSTGRHNGYHEFAVVPLVFTLLTLFCSAYICLALIRNQRRYYHLWNRIAVLLFTAVSLNQIFRLGIISYDIHSKHAQLSAAACKATFAINEFLSSFVDVSYCTMLLTMSVPIFAEPESRDKITQTLLFPWTSIAALWALATVLVPLAAGTALEHRRAWCWIEAGNPMRYAFFYVPATVGLLIAGGFTIWVWCLVDTRVSKARVLTFSIAQLLVVSVYFVFAMMEAADPGLVNPDDGGDHRSTAFDVFAAWIGLHEVFRAGAFVVGEKLYPPKLFLCPPENQAAATGATEEAVVSTVAQQQQQQNYGTNQQQQQDAPSTDSAAKQNESQELIATPAGASPAYGDAAVDVLGNLAADTLTYFVLHLQRRSADLDADWASQSEGESAYAGGRGASMRHSDFSNGSIDGDDSVVGPGGAAQYGAHLA